MKNNSKGFTLIELLVVIAIIGILASVVLASLNSARNKGKDAAVKANLSSARPQAEIYYDLNGNYTNICTGTNGISAIVNAAAAVTGATVNNTLTSQGSALQATCHGDVGAWAVEAPLSGNTSSSTSQWCVDSTGAAKRNTTRLGASATAC